ncbi:hypothetical protein [Pukyongiella litopenaei]|nr:hypothetical protein [Pukyongiella litopenaei]
MIPHPSEDSVYGEERGIFGKILRSSAALVSFPAGGAFLHHFSPGFTAYQ